MKKHAKLTLDRLNDFASPKNLAGKLYTERKPVDLACWAAPGRVTYEEARQGEYTPIEKGHDFAPSWSTHWVKLSYEIPADWAGQEVHLLWNSACEACVWENGVPQMAFAAAGNNLVRSEYVISEKAKGGESATLEIEVAVNALFGIGSPEQNRSQGLGVVKQAEIAVFDRNAWDLLWDFVTVADMAQHLPQDGLRAAEAMVVANKMVNAIYLDDPSTWTAAREMAAEFLAKKNGDAAPDMSTVGHAHLDTAWLWPLAETKRKAYRTFSTALHYFEKYPDYKFACSQAQQYDWIKKNQPELYTKIKQAVKDGKFVPTGGAWVEPDCNVPSGESMVRQFLLGQRFFMREFGIQCTEFWQPDVFGYAAQLPQIMQGAGITRFLTQKLSWNEFNKLPTHSFWWQGIDGSKVLTHFPPADTYNGAANVQQINYAMKNYKDHGRTDKSYYLFGHGDGGAGPDWKMLERLDRMKNLDGLPRLTCRTPQEFFDGLESDAENFITWVGELYFELHRGTYTTQGHTKDHNRRCEILLHDIEFLSLLNLLTDGSAYPCDTLQDLWERVLTNQFHDILPGSSISEVYTDCDEDYADIRKQGDALLATATDALATRETKAGKDGVMAINTAPFARSEVVELPVGISGAQTLADGTQLGVVEAPQVGWSVSRPETTVANPVSLVAEGKNFVFENTLVKVLVKADGRVHSYMDKRNNREVIEPGTRGNNLVMFEDQTPRWDAWDMFAFHLEKFRDIDSPISMEILEEGPVRASLKAEYDMGSGNTLSQVISLCADSPRMDFRCHADWNYRDKFLKVEFPVDIHAAAASYEIQFGHLQRPNHFNTSWDVARFEVCGHRWADFSENGYGVALLNDNKYGYAVHGNIMRLSLLRGPQYPAPDADIGEHDFSWALYPHAGSLQEGGVIEEGYAFNYPLQLRTVAASDATTSIFSIDNPAVIIENIKKAEDSDDIIVRLYEGHGSRGPATLSTKLPVKGATRCNLLEEDGEKLAIENGKIALTVKPFEIVSLKLSCQRD